MIFVDTNVIMYAVGRAHPLRGEARSFFDGALSRREALATSAEVLQELLHAYLPVGRLETLDAALHLADSCIPVVWPVDAEDVHFARVLVRRHPALGARDLLHLSCCKRRKAAQLKTFDRPLAAAFLKG
ncbi:MAG TPA: type II toxin-antitoxin system VapC family toxin [Vicinamibacteria bacterium]|nr:type II toxin-antitoxin system VapC family toxin [Vicinamibacteria bacterium]